MIAEKLKSGEVAVVGLGASGEAVARLLRANHAKVYASDSSSSTRVEEVAQRLGFLGVDARSGGHDLDRIAGAALVVTSPGVPPEAAPLTAARRAGVPIVSEVEVALTFLPSAQIIAVTGTNGKSTVTALVAHLLRALGLKAEAAGNIGRPLSELALQADPPAWVALEISSFQLHDTFSLKPRVGVLTNLSPDHLDRYPSVEEYYADKRLLFRNATRDSRWVVNGDDERVLELAEDVPGVTLRFSAAGRLADAFYDREHDSLILMDEPLLSRSELPLIGDHNVANALAAALAVAAAAPAHTSLTARRSLANALRAARPLPHRLEVVGDRGGVLWINDSKATTVESARVALAAMTRPTVLLLGGRHKGVSYRFLEPELRRHCKLVLAYGEAADLIEVRPVMKVRGGLDKVVQAAKEFAQRGDCVLLSPACASFDMFGNFEERGEAFRAAVGALARGDG
ncbi:MAG TPA: UDP-N-acetylmuramoyl-L-alanine--D-glutamate ligase [Gemmatimonadaceae bacterium]|nr:UDP-N-acetylmuramoyl-L-alanine--D-glutamate ligase [Gemmatimonadaceae bacterium]